MAPRPELGSNHPPLWVMHYCFGQVESPKTIVTTFLFSFLDTKGKIFKVVLFIGKFILLLMLLYVTISIQDVMTSALELLSGKAACDLLKDNVLGAHPVVWPMIGMVVTIILQSSSVSFSIVSSMLSAQLLDTQSAILTLMEVIMGMAVSNASVAVIQAAHKKKFSRVIAAATVHVIYILLTVLILFILETSTGALYHLTSLIVDSFQMKSGMNDFDLIKVIIKPLTTRIIQVDNSVISAIATRDAAARSMSMIKVWHKKNTMGANCPPGGDCWEKCNNFNLFLSFIGVHLFVTYEGHDINVGIFLFLICLICLLAGFKLFDVVLDSMLKGQVTKVIKAVNEIWVNFFLPGVDVISLERTYPLFLGSDLGTAGLSILYALACPGETQAKSFSYLFDICVWYIIPCVRFSIWLAKGLGEKIAKYRWFGLIVLFVFFLFYPAIVFWPASAGWKVWVGVGACAIVLSMAHVIYCLFNVIEQLLVTLSLGRCCCSAPSP
uniref:Uncharacterized protein n=1 Tax=Gouania willdenowi TaxID=441366 RepID=A0A8C5NER9_GOUWI